jgi:hypothetical protein
MRSALPLSSGRYRPTGFHTHFDPPTMHAKGDFDALADPLACIVGGSKLATHASPCKSMPHSVKHEPTSHVASRGNNFDVTYPLLFIACTVSFRTVPEEHLAWGCHLDPGTCLHRARIFLCSRRYMRTKVVAGEMEAHVICQDSSRRNDKFELCGTLRLRMLCWLSRVASGALQRCMQHHYCYQPCTPCPVPSP